MTRRTGTGLMEASGLGTITGDQASLTTTQGMRIILVLIFLGEDNGMTSVAPGILKDQSVSTTQVQVRDPLNKQAPPLF